MTNEELEICVALHVAWIKDKEGGERAKFD